MDCGFKSIDELIKKFIIQNGSKIGPDQIIVCDYSKYRFHSITRLDFKDKMSSYYGHTLSEVVMGNHPFRAVFDLDLNTTNSDKGLDKIEVAKTIFYELQSTIKMCQKYHTGDMSRVVILDSSRKKGSQTMKISLHIHVPSMQFTNATSARAFVNMYNALSTHKLDVLYKSIFQVRSCGGIKEKTRLKPIHIENLTASDPIYDDYIITYPIERDVDPSEEDYKDGIYGSLSIDLDSEYDIEDKTVIEVLIKSGKVDMSAFSLHKLGVNSWRLKRVASSYCSLCDRNHDSDNMMVTVKKGEKGTHVMILGCFRDLERSILINLDGSNSFEINHSLSNWSNIIAEFRNGMIHNRIKDARKQNAITKEFKTLDEFAMNSKAKALFFKAPTGSGKTQAMIKMVNVILGQPNTAIIILSHRKTLTVEMAANMKSHDPIIYNEVMGPIYGHLVIIQIDSLPRLQTEYFKTKRLHIFVDEACGIYDHYFNLEHNRCRNVGMVMYSVMSNAERIYMMDAYLDPMIWRPIEEFITTDIDMAANMENREAAIKYVLTNNEIEFLQKIKTVASNCTKRIIIISSSLEYAEFLKELLLRLNYYTEENLVVYSSRMPDKTVKKHFSNINQEILKYQCVIYTSKVSVGISITAPVDHVFLYCSSFARGHSAIEIMQMIKRARCCKEYLLYVSFAPQNVLSSYDNFVEWIMNLPMIPYGQVPVCYGEIDRSIWFRFMVSICAASHEIRLRSVKNFMMEFLVLLTEYGGNVELGDCLANEMPTDKELEIFLSSIPKTMAEREAELIFDAGNNIHPIVSPPSETEFYMIDYAQIYNQLVSFYKVQNISRHFIERYYRQSKMIDFRHHCELFTYIPTVENFRTLDNLKLSNTMMQKMAGFTKNFGRVMAVYEILYGLGYDGMFGSHQCEREMNAPMIHRGVRRYMEMNPNTNNKILKNKVQLLDNVENILKRYGIVYNKVWRTIDFAGSYYYRIIGTNNRREYEDFESLVKSFNHQVDTGNRESYDHPVITISQRDFTNLKNYKNAINLAAF